MPKRLTIVTSGHPSTCPRMVKAADAAVEAGYDVRLVSVDYIGWAAPLDRDLVSTRSWRWSPIRLRRETRPIASRVVSARHRLARLAADRWHTSDIPFSTVVRAYGRVHPELVSAILAEPCDFIYGGTSGAIAATAEAAARAGKAFALDLEDFHPAESEDADAALTHALASRVLRRAIDNVSFLTAASNPIAAAYGEHYSARPLVTHNVVPRPSIAPALEPTREPLKLYWFSQVIGPHRGLEDVVRAASIARVPFALHLRGVARNDYVAGLRRLARDDGANLEIVVHDPASPDAMVSLCRAFDIGLSLEQEGVLNRALCLPNKPLTYLAAGLAVIATDTAGQQTLRDETGEGIWWYRPGDVVRLAEGLLRWHEDRGALVRARHSAYQAALNRFHWEHADERGVLIEALSRSVA